MTKIPRAWLPGIEKFRMPRIEMNDNLCTVLVIAILCVGTVYFTKEIRGCKSDINSNIATCIESSGDPYLCCINYSTEGDQDDCLDKEKARKLQGTPR